MQNIQSKKKSTSPLLNIKLLSVINHREGNEVFFLILQQRLEKLMAKH
jgi:hypothetical protein